MRGSTNDHLSNWDWKTVVCRIVEIENILLMIRENEVQKSKISSAVSI